MARFDDTVALISGGARGMGASHARALVAEGAKVTSIHPGPIKTPMTGDLGDEMTLANPFRGWQRWRRSAKLLLFMAADATFSTGSEWVVDGGAALGPGLDI